MPASRLLRVALTGGIATGKSYCLRRFASLGVPVVDADLLAREAVRAGSPGLKAVVARFGADVLGPAGALDRAALARIVFNDPDARRDLEKIVHPFVYKAIEDWFAGLVAGGAHAVAVADVPLLYESGGDGAFDRVVVAACRPDQQVERLRARDGLTEEEARLRLAAQWPIDRKRALADIVIDTSGSIEETDAQVDAAHARLTQEAARAMA